MTGCIHIFSCVAGLIHSYHADFSVFVSCLGVREGLLYSFISFHVTHTH